jgi:hypothetical protein
VGSRAQVADLMMMDLDRLRRRVGPLGRGSGAPDVPLSVPSPPARYEAPDPCLGPANSSIDKMHDFLIKVAQTRDSRQMGRAQLSKSDAQASQRGAAAVALCGDSLEAALRSRRFLGGDAVCTRYFRERLAFEHAELGDEAHLGHGRKIALSFRPFTLYHLR